LTELVKRFNFHFKDFCVSLSTFMLSLPFRVKIHMTDTVTL